MSTCRLLWQGLPWVPRDGCAHVLPFLKHLPSSQVTFLDDSPGCSSSALHSTHPRDADLLPAEQLPSCTLRSPCLPSGTCPQIIAIPCSPKSCSPMQGLLSLPTTRADPGFRWPGACTVWRPHFGRERCIEAFIRKPERNCVE